MDTTTGVTLQADVCVVGAGPAGLTLALGLSGRGLDVLLLEAGPSTGVPGGTDVEGTRSVGLPYSPSHTRSSGVGGSSLRWRVETPAGGGHVRLKEMDAQAFETRDWLASTGWPFTRDELARHYRAARDLVGLPPAGTRDVDLPLGVQRRVYSFLPAGVFTSDLPARLRRRPDVRILAGCRVTEVATAADGQVSALRCRLEDGASVAVGARAYVLAGGAIENARLLLSSPGAGPGVGNHHDQVGRYFMEHPHYFCGVVLPRSVTTGLHDTKDTWDVVRRHGALEQDKYALPPEVQREHRLLEAAYKVKEHATVGLLGFGQDGRVAQDAVDAFHDAGTAVRAGRAGPLLRSVRPLLPAAPDIARYGVHRAATRARDVLGRPPRVHHGYRLLVMGEQEPSPLSRVRLTRARDDLGVPLAELDWRLTAADRRSMVLGQRLVAPGLARAVSGRVVWTLGPEGYEEPAGGAHHMGTTRMSVRPEHGVVDADCRVHGVPNLWVAGSSVFPTAGAANPTLTIVALALRLAEHLGSVLAVSGSGQRGIATGPAVGSGPASPVSPGSGAGILRAEVAGDGS